MSRKKQTLRERTQWVALCGLLVALMLVLGFVESLMPVAAGVPGIKLGLSNGVLIFAVYMLNLPTAFVLMVLKVALAMVILSTPSLMYYMAVLMVAGLITGAVTGVAANLVMKHLAKIRR